MMCEFTAAVARRAPWESKLVREREVRRCRRCRKRKPDEEFQVFTRRASGTTHRRSVCRTCRKIAQAEYSASPEGVAARRAYRARPEVKARVRERSRARREDAAVTRAQAAWHQSPRGKLSVARSRARKQLREAADPVAVARWTARVAMLDAEITRTDARRQAVAS